MKLKRRLYSDATNYGTRPQRLNSEEDDPSATTMKTVFFVSIVFLLVSLINRGTSDKTGLFHLVKQSTSFFNVEGMQPNLGLIGADLLLFPASSVYTSSEDYCSWDRSDLVDCSAASFPTTSPQACPTGKFQQLGDCRSRDVKGEQLIEFN